MNYVDAARARAEVEFLRRIASAWERWADREIAVLKVAMAVGLGLSAFTTLAVIVMVIQLMTSGHLKALL